MQSQCRWLLLMLVTKVWRFVLLLVPSSLSPSLSLPLFPLSSRVALSLLFPPTFPISRQLECIDLPWPATSILEPSPPLRRLPSIFPCISIFSMLLFRTMSKNPIILSAILSEYTQSYPTPINFILREHSSMNMHSRCILGRLTMCGSAMAIGGPNLEGQEDFHRHKNKTCTSHSLPCGDVCFWNLDNYKRSTAHPSIWDVGPNAMDQ